MGFDTGTVHPFIEDNVKAYVPERHGVYGLFSGTKEYPNWLYVGQAKKQTLKERLLQQRYKQKLWIEDLRKAAYPSA